MGKLQEIIDCYPDEMILKADGFDDAVIGIEVPSMRLVYSVSKCLEILREQMSDEPDFEETDPIEHFDFNVRGSYVGELTPIWVEDEF